MKASMKTPLFVLLIISLLFSASYGMAMMSHLDGQEHSECPFEAAVAVNCNQNQNPVGFVTSHLNAFARFFSAVPTGFYGLILLSVVLLCAAFYLLDKKRTPLELKSLIKQSHVRKFFTPPSRILLTHWFALHENSPAMI